MNNHFTSLLKVRDSIIFEYLLLENSIEFQIPPSFEQTDA
jgi:hypothetical protein